MSVTVMLSNFGTLSGSILTSPRIFKAMADDGVILAAFSKVHLTFEYPWPAVAQCGSLGVVFVLMRSFEQLADNFVTAIIPFYALGVMAVFAGILIGLPAYWLTVGRTVH